MNRRQKVILIKFVAVMVITAIAIVALTNFRHWVNRSEAMRAMEHLRLRVKQYRDEHGSVPPESWVDSQIENLPGHVRLGNLHYRGLWIDFESTPDAILAYTERNYRSLLVGKGYIVLRLDGRVDWMGKKEFQALFAAQRHPEEIPMHKE